MAGVFTAITSLHCMALSHKTEPRAGSFAIFLRRRFLRWFGAPGFAFARVAVPGRSFCLLPFRIAEGATVFVLPGDYSGVLECFFCEPP